MIFGEVREFDFYPFYVRTWGERMPVPLSAVPTVLMAGSMDATPYPCTLLNALPTGYVLLPYGVALGPGALDLLLVSSRPIGEVRSLGIIKGYEFILHILEDTLRERYSLSLKDIRMATTSDVVPGMDAYVLYGDIALRGGYDEFPYVYNLAEAYNGLKGKPLRLAVWIARKERAEEAEMRIGNSLAYWMLRRDELILSYSQRRKIPMEVLYTHAEALVFRGIDKLP